MTQEPELFHLSVDGIDEAVTLVRLEAYDHLQQRYDATLTLEGEQKLRDQLRSLEEQYEVWKHRAEVYGESTDALGLGERLATIRGIVEAQADDEGLWFIAESITESHLQQELRRLHAAIEGATTEHHLPTSATVGDADRVERVRRLADALDGTHGYADVGAGDDIRRLVEQLESTRSGLWEIIREFREGKPRGYDGPDTYEEDDPVVIIARRVLAEIDGASSPAREYVEDMNGVLHPVAPESSPARSPQTHERDCPCESCLDASSPASEPEAS